MVVFSLISVSYSLLFREYSDERERKDGCWSVRSTRGGSNRPRLVDQRSRTAIAPRLSSLIRQDGASELPSSSHLVDVLFDVIALLFFFSFLVFFFVFLVVAESQRFFLIVRVASRLDNSNFRSRLSSWLSFLLLSTSSSASVFLVLVNNYQSEGRTVRVVSKTRGKLTEARQSPARSSSIARERARTLSRRRFLSFYDLERSSLSLSCSSSLLKFL